MNEPAANLLQRLLDERYEDGRRAGYEAGVRAGRTAAYEGAIAAIKNLAERVALYEGEVVHLPAAVETGNGSEPLSPRMTAIVHWVREHPGQSCRQIRNGVRCGAQAPYKLAEAGHLVRRGAQFFAAP